MVHHIFVVFVLLCSFINLDSHNSMYNHWNVFIQSSSYIIHTLACIFAFNIIDKQKYILYGYKLCICAFTISQLSISIDVFALIKQLFDSHSIYIEHNNHGYINTDVILILLYIGWVSTLFWSRLVWFI